MTAEFGRALKEWRNIRRVSQLDLGLMANVSARHISFLETGRSRPSQPMIRNLCEYLDVPRPARNAMLNAAGFAAVHGDRSLSDSGMDEIRAALDWTLDRHDPYPAMAIDRHWTLVRSNKTAQLLLSSTGLKDGDSLLPIFADPENMAMLFKNWETVAQHMVARLRTESAHLGGDTLLDAAVEKLMASLGAKRFEHEGVLPAVIPAQYIANGMTMSFFSTIAQFGTAEDIALSDLKIELMFPADEETRLTLLALANQPASTAH